MLCCRLCHYSAPGVAISSLQMVQKAVPKMEKQSNSASQCTTHIKCTPNNKLDYCQFR